jgi:hypothetical protein
MKVSFKAINLIHADGTRTLAFIRPMNFDTQAWANKRIDSFKLLNIVKVEEEIVDSEEV